jgi:hypothetical protein
VLDVLCGRRAYERLLAWSEEADRRVHPMDSVLTHGPARQEVEALLMALNRKSVVEP